MSSNTKSNKKTSAPTKKYTVIREFLLDGKTVEAGKKIDLQKEAAFAFAKKHRISMDEFDKLNKEK